MHRIGYARTKNYRAFQVYCIYKWKYMFDSMKNHWVMQSETRIQAITLMYKSTGLKIDENYIKKISTEWNAMLTLECSNHANDGNSNFLFFFLLFNWLKNTRSSRIAWSIIKFTALKRSLYFSDCDIETAQNHICRATNWITL